MRLDAMKIMRFHGIEMVISWDLRRSYPVVSSNVASWEIPNQWRFIAGKIIMGEVSIAMFDYRRYIMGI